jgi:hypothetical protein
LAAQIAAVLKLNHDEGKPQTLRPKSRRLTAVQPI